MALSDKQQIVLKKYFRDGLLLEAFEEMVDSLHRKRYLKLHKRGPETKDELTGGCMALDELIHELKQLHKVASKTDSFPPDQADAR